MPAGTDAAAMPNIHLFVQHLLGIGHLHRALRIANACTARGMKVTLISGGDWPKQLTLPSGIKLVQLAPLSAADAGFSGLVTNQGIAPDEAYWHQRQQQLHSLSQDLPDIVLFELFPFGRRQLRHELIQWLEHLHQLPQRPLCISSVRDILVRKQNPEKAVQREAQMLEWFTRYFDYALIHGDPGFIEFSTTFPPATGIAEKLCYTGLVCPPKPAPGARNGIVISCGGGAVGQQLLNTALAAHQLDPLGQPWELYTGPNLPQADLDALPAAPGVKIERYHPDFCQRLACASLSVSQAGYNTVADLLVSDTPAVLIPFAQHGESEQTLRAEALAAAGRMTMVTEDKLTPEALLEAMGRALALQRSTPLNTQGANNCAKQLLLWHRDRGLHNLKAHEERSGAQHG